MTVHYYNRYNDRSIGIWYYTVGSLGFIRIRPILRPTGSRLRLAVRIVTKLQNGPQSLNQASGNIMLRGQHNLSLWDYHIKEY